MKDLSVATEHTLNARIHTAAHILTHVIEKKFVSAIEIGRKINGKNGILKISSETKLQNFDFVQITKEVNNIIRQNLPIFISIQPRSVAQKRFDLRFIPKNESSVKIVTIQNLCGRASQEPAVANTGEIGIFLAESIKKLKENTYAITFQIS